MRHPVEPNSKQVRKLCHRVYCDFIHTLPIPGSVLPAGSYSCVYLTPCPCCYHSTPGQRLVFLTFLQTPTLSRPILYVCSLWVLPKIQISLCYSCLNLLNVDPFCPWDKQKAPDLDPRDPWHFVPMALSNFLSVNNIPSFPSPWVTAQDFLST